MGHSRTDTEKGDIKSSVGNLAWIGPQKKPQLQTEGCRYVRLPDCRGFQRGRTGRPMWLRQEPATWRVCPLGRSDPENYKRANPGSQHGRKKMDFLGRKVKDKITGFEGIVTDHVNYLSGCNQCLVAPRVGNDGCSKDAQWIDDQRLEVSTEDKCHGNLCSLTEAALCYSSFSWRQLYAFTGYMRPKSGLHEHRRNILQWVLWV